MLEGVGGGAQAEVWGPVLEKRRATVTAVLSSQMLPLQSAQGCSTGPIPLVSTYREEIGSGWAPKSTNTDQTHRLQGDSPAINCLNKITYFRYFSCPSAEWV